MTERPPQKKNEGGAPAWIVTFADLMSLLMTFFVLLLSFAELDVMKFKAVAGSMRLAFGVQRDVRALEIPKGTSIIAQEFSPGRPQPSPLNEVRQKSTEDDKQTLEFTDALADHSADRGSGSAVDRAHEQARERADKMVAALQKEVDNGMIQVETVGGSVVVRILEKGSFPSGTARFDADFLPVIAKLRAAIKGVHGKVAVAGHTDNVPIKTSVYRSNWDLSAARAVSVVHELLEDADMDPGRFVVEGHGDAHPIVPNDSASNRALNRRVELTIHQDEAAADERGEPAIFQGR